VWAGGRLLAWGVCSLCAALAGCGGSSHGTRQSHAVDEAAIAGLVERAVDSKPSPGLKGRPAVHCRPASHGECTIAYTPNQALGGAWENESIDPTFAIWQALFEDPSLRKASITVEVPASYGRRPARPPELEAALFTLTCDRGDFSKIDWGTATSAELRRDCRFSVPHTQLK
jgi:hypothetical protein